MDVRGNERLRFGDFEFDSLSGRLFRGERPVKIQPQPLRVLAALLEKAGEIVSREHLRTRIWGDSTFVEFDQGLNYCIRQIRLALRDGASKPLYIETLPKQGYRFIAQVTVSDGCCLSRIRQPARFRRIRRRTRSTSSRTASPARPRLVSVWRLAFAVFAALAIGGAALYSSLRPRPAGVKYTQLTDFTDSALAPALSPDGRMVAFIRGSSSFLTADQIYVKVLPNGEARRLTDDPRLKYNLAFTPDGAQIAYTVLQLPNWATYTVSVLGGDSHLFLGNAAGLTLARPAPASLFPNPFRPAYGNRYRSRDRAGISRAIFSTTRTGDGALLLGFSRPQIGLGRRDGRKRGLGALPADFARRPLRRRAHRPPRTVHVCRLVAGWVVDVFHGFGGRAQPPVAPALSGRKAGADHVWPDRSGRSGGRAGWPFHHHFDGSACKAPSGFTMPMASGPCRRREKSWRTSPLPPLARTTAFCTTFCGTVRMVRARNSGA